MSWGWDARRSSFNIEHSTFRLSPITLPPLMSLLLYLSVALLLLWIAHRALTPISKPAAIALLLLPMCITGKALLTGGVFGPVDLPYFTEPLRDMRVPLGVARPHN